MSAEDLILTPVGPGSAICIPAGTSITAAELARELGLRLGSLRDLPVASAAPYIFATAGGRFTRAVPPGGPDDPEGFGFADIAQGDSFELGEVRLTATLEHDARGEVPHDVKTTSRLVGHSAWVSAAAVMAFWMPIMEPEVIVREVLERPPIVLDGGWFTTEKDPGEPEPPPEPGGQGDERSERKEAKKTSDEQAPAPPPDPSASAKDKDKESGKESGKAQLAVDRRKNRETGSAAPTAGPAMRPVYTTGGSKMQLVATRADPGHRGQAMERDIPDFSTGSAGVDSGVADLDTADRSSPGTSGTGITSSTSSSVGVGGVGTGRGGEPAQSMSVDRFIASDQDTFRSIKQAASVRSRELNNTSCLVVDTAGISCEGHLATSASDATLTLRPCGDLTRGAWLSLPDLFSAAQSCR